MHNSKYKELSEKLLGEDAFDNDINRICLVLEDWEKQISKHAFPIFEHIVRKFNYYSSGKAASVFKKLDSEFHYLSEKEVLFLPLRTEDRMESSVPLVSMLQLHLLMNISRTNFKDSGSALRDIYMKKREFSSAYRLTEAEMPDTWFDCALTRSILKCEKDINDLRQEQIGYEEEKNDLISKLKAGEPIPKDADVKTISDKIKLVKKKICNKGSEKSGLLNAYLLDNVSLIQAKNVVIFDDFLCTGTSVNDFIEENIEYFKKLSDVQFLFLFLESTTIGRRKVEKTIEANKLSNVKIGFEVESINVDHEIENLSQSDFEIFQQEEDRIESLFDFEESEYQCRTAIASFINSPNSNCNFLCSRGNGKWHPLFERKVHPKINVNQEILEDTIRRYSN